MNIKSYIIIGAVKEDLETFFRLEGTDKNVRDRTIQTSSEGIHRLTIKIYKIKEDIRIDIQERER